MTETAQMPDAGTGAANSPDAASTGSNGSANGHGGAGDPSDKAFRAGWAKSAERTRREVLGELGLDTEDKLNEFHSWRQGAEASKPEAEKLKASYSAQQRAWETKQRELSQKVSEYEKKLAEQAEINLALILRGESSEIARELNAFNAESVYEFIDRRCKPISSGDGTKMIFTDGDVTVDMDDKDARKKLSEHLVKVRPEYFRTHVTGGAGTGISMRVTPGKDAPRNSSELAQAIVSKLTIAR